VTSLHDALVQMLDTCHVRVCRAKWPAVRDHPEGGGEQAGHPPLVGVHPVLLLPHLCPGHGSLLVSPLFHLSSLYAYKMPSLVFSSDSMHSQLHTPTHTHQVRHCAPVALPYVGEPGW